MCLPRVVASRYPSRSVFVLLVFIGNGNNSKRDSSNINTGVKGCGRKEIKEIASRAWKPVDADEAGAWLQREHGRMSDSVQNL